MTNHCARPRVALVAHAVHDNGGMERACAELIRHGSDSVRFTVISAELDPSLVPLVDRWIRIRTPMKPASLGFLCFFARASWSVHRIDVDLIHTVGAIIPNRVDIATVQFCHRGARQAQRASSRAGHDAGWLRRANSKLLQWMSIAAETWCYRPQRLRRFAAVSSGAAGEVAHWYPTVPCDVVPNGVDVNRFRPNAHQRARTRAEFAAGGSLVALFVGGDWRRKGLSIAIDAVASVRAAGHDVVLWVVGSGDVGRALAHAGESVPLRLLGRRTDTERFYAAADMFVLPSAYETFSLVMLEAAAVALPAVASSFHSWFGDDHQAAGATIVPRTVEAFATALTRLAACAELRVELGQRGHQLAQSFTWQNAAEANLRLYRQLLAEPHRPTTR